MVYIDSTKIIVEHSRSIFTLTLCSWKRREKIQDITWYCYCKYSLLHSSISHSNILLAVQIKNRNILLFDDCSHKIEDALLFFRVESTVVVVVVFYLKCNGKYTYSSLCSFSTCRKRISPINMRRRRAAIIIILP